MVKYFETLIKHPQTNTEVLVYCKVVLEDLNESKELECFTVHTGEKPFMIKKMFKKTVIDNAGEIQPNYFREQVNFITNLFK